MAQLREAQTQNNSDKSESSSSIDDVLGENPEMYSIDTLLNILKHPKPSTSPKAAATPAAQSEPEAQDDGHVISVAPLQDDEAEV